MSVRQTGLREGSKDVIAEGTALPLFLQRSSLQEGCQFYPSTQVRFCTVHSWAEFPWNQHNIVEFKFPNHDIPNSRGLCSPVLTRLILLGT